MKKPMRKMRSGEKCLHKVLPNSMSPKPFGTPYLSMSSTCINTFNKAELFVLIQTHTLSVSVVCRLFRSLSLSISMSAIQ